mmetsp:Transcript_15710/g.42651  ORF Transcript_15710/g.42651 Transcript_15710/m.42651 type:complete len:84 (+) Transcript_15710:397-648(+)
MGKARRQEQGLATELWGLALVLLSLVAPMGKARKQVQGLASMLQGLASVLLPLVVLQAVCWALLVMGMAALVVVVVVHTGIQG